MKQKQTVETETDSLKRNRQLKQKQTIETETDI
jgi:hypothetical protein